MSAVGLVLLIGGAALIVVGVSRARGPWIRYRALQAEDENVARYDAWRGGVRDRGTTGASVAMAVLRRQAELGGVVILGGVVAVVAGFLVH